MTLVIDPRSFPTPHLAMRTVDDDELRRVREFAVAQAAAANALSGSLSGAWHRVPEPDERARLLRRGYAELQHWRYDLARRTPGRIGTGLAADAERFRATIDRHGANYDRLGWIGRLRANSVWDEATRTFLGGDDTPAHRIMIEYGDAAKARFARDGVTGDVLHNRVVLPDGTSVAGNRLVRGAEALRVARKLLARIESRGGDTGQVETGGRPLYVVTADNSTRTRIFCAAMDLLARTEPGDVTSWLHARYLLYQAPITKKGSDAVIRTFTVAVGAVLLDEPPILEHDVDLRCLVLGQERVGDSLAVRSTECVAAQPISVS